VAQHRTAPTPEWLRAQAERIAWYHTIDLGQGVVTRGIDPDPGARARAYRLPTDLSGKTVLDVGAWDGFFSFEAERRGARRVLAVDSFSWSGAGWGTKDGFELARRALGSRVEDAELEHLELSAERIGVFDVVLFLGVLYHMRHPLLALERVAAVTGELLILETHVEAIEPSRPAMLFYPGDELNRDSSNRWGPNPAAVLAMLKDVGFRSVEIVWEERVAGPPAATGGFAGSLFGRLLKGDGSPAARPDAPGRIAVHARK
jgi:tRNA (mo5U34)-methyltransferase